MDRCSRTKRQGQPLSLTPIGPTLPTTNSEPPSTLSLSLTLYLQTMNEELFRLYALWTFAISGVYTIIYLGIFLNQYRMAFFIFLGLVTITVLLYWFRDGGNKEGWQSLDESILIVLFLAAVMAILMIIACVLASKNTNYSPQVFSDFSATIQFAFRISPIIFTVINLVNLLLFIARN